jgi:hypothetical protein
MTETYVILSEGKDLAPDGSNRNDRGPSCAKDDGLFRTRVVEAASRRLEFSILLKLDRRDHFTRHVPHFFLDRLIGIERVVASRIRLVVADVPIDERVSCRVLSMHTLDPYARRDRDIQMPNSAEIGRSNAR